MSKAFFEKLTQAGRVVSTRESVINNVERILNYGGYLDAGVDASVGPANSRLKGIYRTGLVAVVDQSLDNKDQIIQFQLEMVRVLKAFEPRIKQVEVVNIGQSELRSKCQLKIQLSDEDFEQEFIFG